MDQAQETTIALAVFTIWITFLYIRVFDKTVKKYILSIGVLLIFWMTIKIIRCDSNGVVSDILWYLYYLPLIFIPTLFYICSNSLLVKLYFLSTLSCVHIPIASFVICTLFNLIISKSSNKSNSINKLIPFFLLGLEKILSSSSFLR